MSAQILATLPESGKYQEISYGEKFTATCHILFNTNNDLEWLGHFAKNSDIGFSGVVTNADNNLALVVAGGQGYLINIESKELLPQLHNYSNLDSLLKTNNPDFFLVGAGNEILVFDFAGNLNVIVPDFLTDGIYFKEQQGNYASGMLDAPMNQYKAPYTFKMDLTTFGITIKSTHKPGFWEKFLGF